MAQIRWSKKALAQLERNISYIAEEQSSTYAEVVLSRILTAVDLLQEQPRMGPIEPLLEYRLQEYRSLVVWSFKIVYKVHSNSDILIARVFHTAQHPSKLKR
ncbi:MAG: type II toxin-antitoxin system RelE/ParE family toxin [Bacteroidetes bacterium]|nr:type II toxin-antitoxin system RelE/ParE family toxin [Bacteroidota bacterium]